MVFGFINLGGNFKFRLMIVRKSSKKRPGLVRPRVLPSELSLAEPCDSFRLPGGGPPLRFI